MSLLTTIALFSVSTAASISQQPAAAPQPQPAAQQPPVQPAATQAPQTSATTTGSAQFTPFDATAPQPAQPTATEPQPAPQPQARPTVPPPPVLGASDHPPARDSAAATAQNSRAKSRRKTKERRAAKREWPEREVNYRLEAALAVNTIWAMDPSYMAFDYQRSRRNADFGLRADFKSGKRGFIGADLSYGQRETNGSRLNDLYSKFYSRDIKLALRGALTFVDGIDGYAHVGGGASLITLDFHSQNSTEFKTATWLAQGMLGSMVYVPKKWLPRKGSSRLTMGLDIGAGYRFTGPVEVTPVFDIDEEDEDIPVQTNSLGTLKFHGVQMRLGAFIRFM